MCEYVRLSVCHRVSLFLDVCVHMCVCVYDCIYVCVCVHVRVIECVCVKRSALTQNELNSFEWKDEYETSTSTLNIPKPHLYWVCCFQLRTQTFEKTESE